jgi:hypothetical protein
MYAAAQSNLTIIKYLVENGANINYINHNWDALKAAACLNKSFEIVEYLIKKGAIVTADIINETYRRSLNKMQYYLVDECLKQQPKKAKNIAYYMSDEQKEKYSYLLRGVKTGLWDFKKENISSAFIEDEIENIVNKGLDQLIGTDIVYSIYYHEGPGDVNFTIQIEEMPGGEVYQDELRDRMYEIEDLFLDNEYIHGLNMEIGQNNIEYGQRFECYFNLYLVQEIKRANKSGLLDLKH